MPLKEMRRVGPPATYKKSNNPARQLRHAAWVGNLKEVKQLVKKKDVDVNSVDADGFTPLLIAVRWNRLEVAKFLLEKRRADTTKRTNEGDSVYNVAELHGHTELATYLQSKGVSTAPNKLRAQRASSAGQWLRMSFDAKNPTSVGNTAEDQSESPCGMLMGFDRSGRITPPEGMPECPPSPMSPTFPSPSSPTHDESRDSAGSEPEPQPEPEPEPEPQLERELQSAEPEPEPEPEPERCDEGVPHVVWRCESLADDV